MHIVLVRHGIAVRKKGWTGADLERPLVARGRRQAAGLHKIIGGSRPARIVSSPALRCVQTASPLAGRLGLDVELSDSLATDAGPAAGELCLELLSAAGSATTVLLCTHREVLEVLLPRLAKDFDGRLGHRPAGAKGAAWVLGFEARRLRKVVYHPPAG